MRIEWYDFGRIDVDGQTYTSDVIISADNVMDGWWRRKGHRLDVADLSEVMNHKPDVLVIGTGYYGNMAVPSETRSFLESQGIEVRAMETRDAVKEFNKLQKQTGKIVAALHLTC
ncbi:MAG: Mth938-like domain-containing protein [Acidiferrobacterales bacterium]